MNEDDIEREYLEEQGEYEESEVVHEQDAEKSVEPETELNLEKNQVNEAESKALSDTKSLVEEVTALQAKLQEKLNILIEHGESDKLVENQQVSDVLHEISDTLKLLNQQINPMENVVAELSKCIAPVAAAKNDLESVSADFDKMSRKISVELPEQIKGRCEEGYKEIFDMAAENYNRMQHDADRWQRDMMKKRGSQLEAVVISSYLTPVLVVIAIFMLWKMN